MGLFRVASLKRASQRPLTGLHGIEKLLGRDVVKVVARRGDAAVPELIRNQG